MIEENAVHGIRWALGKIGVQDVSVIKTEIPDATLIAAKKNHPVVKKILERESIKLPASAFPDTIIIKSLKNNSVLITGENDRSLIYGILESAKHRDKSKIDIVEQPSFNRRIYKHEISDAENGSRLLKYVERKPWYLVSDEFWQGLFQQMSGARFNGLVIWTFQPFEQWIWNEKYPEARTLKHSEYQRNSQCLRRILEWAEAYDIEVSFQIYFSHCSKPFCDAHNLLSRSANHNGGEDMPLIREYNAYCIDKIFKEYPGINGLWLNLESMNDAEAIEATVIDVLLKQKRNITLFIRVWDIYATDSIQRLSEKIRGSNIRLVLTHKPTMDVYHYPNPDPKMKIWKKDVPDAEILMMHGPCHTTSKFELCYHIWADRHYVQTLLRKCHDMGVVNISFNTLIELFDKPPADDAFDFKERIIAFFNKPHLAMASAYSWKTDGGADTAEWIDYLQNEYKVTRRGAEYFLKCLDSTSKIICLVHRQYFPQDVYFIYPEKQPYVQEPYAKETAGTFADRKGEYHPHTGKLPPAVSYLEEDYPKVIDFLNGAESVNTPLTVAAGLDKAASDSIKYAELFLKHDSGFKNKKYFMEFIQDQACFAAFFSNVIRAGVELYALNQCSTPAGFIKKCDKGLKLLRAACKNALESEAHSKAIYGSLPLRYTKMDSRDISDTLEKWQAVRDRVSRDKNSFSLFKIYLDSLHQFIETRRYIRPVRVYADQKFDQTAAQCINKAVASLTDKSKMISEENPHNRFFPAWQNFLFAQLNKLSVKEMICHDKQNDTINTQPWNALAFDDAFGRGTSLADDYLNFFNSAGKFPAYNEYIRFNAVYDNDALYIEIHGQSERGNDLYKRWDNLQEIIGSIFFIGIEINPAGDKKQLFQWNISPFDIIRRFHIQVGKNYALLSLSIPDLCGASSVVSRLKSGLWQAKIKIPFSSFAHAPKKGECWDFNIHCNPALVGNEDYAWNATFEGWRLGNPLRQGKIYFEK